MSPRQEVDRQRIEHFFQKLGESFHHPARIYLVGGTTVVFEALREQTLDIDVSIDVAPAHHGELMRILNELKERLSLNLEEVSPADFIPLPRSHRDGHVFIARYGSIDLFHFDLYSTCLSKLERGTAQDFDDVLSLLDAGKVDWTRLEDGFREILPRMGQHSLRQDPRDFERNFRTLERLRRSPRP
jgi:hypothetical protein